MVGRIEVITAAAGAGKTTRIVEEIAGWVGPRPPEQLVATTFTIRAADELLERTRARLFGQGRADDAARILGARFGTVNAVCGQIVAEYALELGRSPASQVIDDVAQRLVFAIAADSAIGEHAVELNELAAAFGHEDPRPPDLPKSDWRSTVRTIIGLARANGLEALELAESAERSVAGFLSLFPPAGDGESLETALARGIETADAEAPATPSQTAAPGVRAVRTAALELARGRQLTWSMWARLSKMKAAKKDGVPYSDAVLTVVTAASQHARHPRLRQDGERFIRLVFQCAAAGLEAYQTYKEQRGLLDFVDQEANALTILQNGAVSDRLRERLRRVFVDEFQDSSPLQVALFTALSDLVEASTWVGDPKQAIYAFRGADTALTQAAFAGAIGEGTTDPDALTTSHRSRDGIIKFVNAAFGPAFERMGLPAEKNAFSKTTRSDDGFDRPPLGFWAVAGKTLADRAHALAQGVRDTLDEPDEWLVGQKSADHRPLRPGDIAILCRTNTEVLRVAGALNRLGIAAAVEREGLARTPHCELVLAAFRWVVDPSDRLALAEMARFLDGDPESDAWLRAAADEAPEDALQQVVPIAPALALLREQRTALTPGELLDAILALPEMIGTIEAWGDHAIRLDDLEALRGFAQTYEEQCEAGGVSATPHGLLQALTVMDAPRPPSLAAGAVQILTYHGAKGLEWPMVILSSLDWEPRVRPFEPTVEVDGELDWQAPLRNRWLRYWPWPYGLGGAGSEIEVAAHQSPVGCAAMQRAKAEETRLLYVGMTRARDYLVLSSPTGSRGPWLRVLDGEDPNPHLRFPREDDNLFEVGDQTFSAKVKLLEADRREVLRPRAVTYVTTRSPPERVAPLRLRPSEATGETGWRVVERVVLGPRLSMAGNPDMTALGEAVHAVLAYDDPAREPSVRRADAAATLARWGVSALQPEDVLKASDRFFVHAASRWPDSSIRREVPVSASLGPQLIQGRIDLLVETAAGRALVDHKSFPGRLEAWDAKAVSYAPQLELYAQAIEAATGQSCDELWIHMPIVGQLLRVQR